MKKLLIAALTLTSILLCAGCGDKESAEPTTAPTLMIEHVHSWKDGKCTECGAECEHAFIDGVCKNCGVVCNHVWKDGKCEICGLECKHEEYEDGKCKICGMKCTHEFHDLNQICTVCGEKVPHTFNYMSCDICGAKPAMVKEKIGTEMLRKADHQGTITPLYIIDEKKQPKDFLVYTPYGYNKETKYNVIFILHGDGADMHQWIDEQHITDNIEWEMRNLYDNMIEEKLCKPFIAVSLDYQRWRDVYDNEKFMDAMRYDIIPYIIKKYSTYAEGPELDQIVAARDHFCFLGYDRGAAFTYESAIQHGMDVASNFMMIAPRKVGMETNIEFDAETNLFHFVYSGVGGSDISYYASMIHKSILKNAPYLQDNMNAYLDVIRYGQNEWITWATCFYNGIQNIF